MIVPQWLHQSCKRPVCKRRYKYTKQRTTTTIIFKWSERWIVCRRSKYSCSLRFPCNNTYRVHCINITYAYDRTHTQMRHYTSKHTHTWALRCACASNGLYVCRLYLLHMELLRATEFTTTTRSPAIVWHDATDLSVSRFQRASYAAIVSVISWVRLKYVVNVISVALRTILCFSLARVFSSERTRMRAKYD